MSTDGVIEHVRAGERPSAKKYNSLVDFANNAQRAFGAAPTQSSGAPCLAGDVTVRYETSDSELKLKGLEVSDDITAKAGELILVHRETEDDGVYSIQDGSWVRLYRFNFPMDRKEVWGKWELALLPGSMIRVWHDQKLFMVTLVEKEDSSLKYIWAAKQISGGGFVTVDLYSYDEETTFSGLPNPVGPSWGGIAKEDILAGWTVFYLMSFDPEEDEEDLSGIYTISDGAWTKQDIESYDFGTMFITKRGSYAGYVLIKCQPGEGVA